MKWLTLCALLLLVLGIMRAGSWGAGWLLAKLTPAGTRLIAVLSNLAGFGCLVLLLYGDLSPGEPVDIAAVLFGLAVFAVYATTDLFWRPWKLRARPGGTAVRDTEVDIRDR